MKRMYQAWSSILALVAVVTFGLRPTARTSAATSANLAKSATPHPASQAQAVESYGKLPLSFEANRGQTDSRVKFLSRGSGYSLFLTEDEAVLSLHKTEGAPPTIRPTSAAVKSVGTESVKKPKTDNEPRSVLRMKLVGANANAAVTGAEELPGKTNYFIGNDPKKWRTKVPTYAKVQYSGVYPGVDLVYYGNEGGQLEYDFVVGPSADPKAIILDIGVDSVRPGGGEGGTPLQIDSHGDLILPADDGDIRLQKPVVYQEDSDGRKRYIDGRYLLLAEESKIENPKSKICIDVASYDHSRPLVIDPAIVYSTLLGGTTGSYSVGRAIATYTDPSTGHVFAYIAGSTDFSDFPTFNALQNTNAGWFVTKFDPAASGAASVVFSTFLYPDINTGGPTAFAVDSAGNAYLTGETRSPNFPTINAYQATISSGYHAFLTKLSTDGSTLLYSTYFGGSVSDEALAIGMGSAGRVYIAGATQSPDLPVVNPYQASIGPNGGNAFVACFDTTRSGSASLIYSTYFGGSGGSVATGVAVDAAGKIHLVGGTGAGLPIIKGFQTTIGGGFYAELNPSASGAGQLVYSTYLNTQAGAAAQLSIALDSSGNAYLAGYGFVNKINPSLSGQASLVYSAASPAQQAASAAQQWFGIAVDAIGNAFVIGSALPGMPLVNPTLPSANGPMQSINAGESWTLLNNGLTGVPINALAVDVSTSPRTLYAGTSFGGIFSSADGGLNWNQVFQTPYEDANSLPPDTTNCHLVKYSLPGCIMVLAVDPSTPSNVYAGASGGVYKSPDRGATWGLFNSGFSSTAIQQGVRGLTFDSGTLYAGAADGLYKLSPGASSWVSTTQAVDIHNIAFDPGTVPHTIYTASEISGVYKSTDGGATWVQALSNQTEYQDFSAIAVDTATKPATLYSYNLQSGMAKSVDAGNTWIATTSAQYFGGEDFAAGIVVDTTTTPSTVYVCDYDVGLSKSVDGGNSWTNPLVTPMGAMAIDLTTANGTTPATLYAGNSQAYGNAYVEELNPSGSAILFSTYLGGLDGSSGGAGIALDSSDNIYITGAKSVTPTGYVAGRASYFPTLNAFQSNLGWRTQAFFTEFGAKTLPTDSSGSVSTQVAVQTGTIAITFPSIIGSTTSAPPTLTVTPLSSAASANFALPNNLGAYDISTTAEFSASSSNPVTLCFQALTVNDFSTFSNLQLLHIANGSPVNVTTSYNFATRTICGAVTSFSPFVLVKGAAGQLSDLVRAVNESDQRHGIKNSLDVKLQNAISALTSARNNSYSTVCNVMGSFINNVTAQEGNAITVGEATAFISAAKQIKATLGCP